MDAFHTVVNHLGQLIWNIISIVGHNSQAQFLLVYAVTTAFAHSWMSSS